MLVYLGAPIDKSGDPGRNFDILTRAVLAGCPSAVLFRPLYAFHNLVKFSDRVDIAKARAINESVLDRADLRVFMLNGEFTFGTVHEIARAERMGLPSIVWWLSSELPPTYLHTLNKSIDLTVRRAKWWRMVDNSVGDHEIINDIKEFVSNLDQIQSESVGVEEG